MDMIASDSLLSITLEARLTDVICRQMRAEAPDTSLYRRQHPETALIVLPVCSKLLHLASPA